jgi:hypothetical protein
VDLRVQPLSHKSKIVDPTASWKTYTSEAEGLSFKYPADWTTSDPGDPGPGVEAMNFIGPDHLKLSWSDNVYGLGGGCDATKGPHVIFESIEATQLPRVSAITIGKQGTNTSVHSSMGPTAQRFRW